MSTTRGIRPWTMPHDLVTSLLELLPVQDAVLTFLRCHRPHIPKVQHVVVALVVLLQRSARA
eukprot:10971760-Heterocapsa_arctica.AAC.1